MGLILGIIVYVVILAGFISFGRFLKDCDEALVDQLNAKPFAKNLAE